MKDFVRRQLIQVMTSWDCRGSRLWRANPRRLLFQVLSQVSGVRLSAIEKKELGQAVENLVRHKRLLDHAAQDAQNMQNLDLLLRQEGVCSEYRAWQKRLLALEHLPWATLLESSTGTSEVSEAIRFSFPDLLYHKILVQLGPEKCRDFCEASNEIPYWAFLRLNPRSRCGSNDCEQVSMELASLGYTAHQCTRVDKCLQITGPGRVPVQQLSLHLDGRVEIQDESSQLVAGLVDCEPGDTVVDLCSGAGGKSLAIAPRLGRAGNLVLHEPRHSALKRAKDRLRRLSLTNGPCYHFVGSAELNLWMSKADWVLADVPCSNTASLRHHPECKYRCFEMEDDWHEMELLLTTQRQVMRKAACLLKHGGMLVYSTCSVLTEENDLQVSWATSAASQLGVTVVRTQSLLPQKGGSDGFYVAVLKKVDRATSLFICTEKPAMTSNPQSTKMPLPSTAHSSPNSTSCFKPPY